MLLRLSALLLATGAIVQGANCVSAQDYPNKPIRLVTATAGGSADFVARVIAQGMAENLAQQVIVDNRPAGVIQGEILARAPADGYTLLAAGTALWLLPLMQKVPYDPIKDFAPISITTSSPNVLVLHPAVPASSVKELIALAKAKPGVLNYGSSVPGTSSHLASELFKAMAGVDIVRIGYKGGGPARTALLAGQVQMVFAGAEANLTSLVKAGKLKALAVTSLKPSALAPGFPTVAEAGVPGYESGSLDCMFAPANTPAPIIRRLNQEIVRVVNQPEVKQKLFDAGVETVGSSPEELGAKIKSEMERLGALLKNVRFDDK